MSAKEFSLLNDETQKELLGAKITCLEIASKYAKDEDELLKISEKLFSFIEFL